MTSEDIDRCRDVIRAKAVAQPFDDFYATIDILGKDMRVMHIVNVQKMLMDAECSMSFADDVLSQLSVLNPGREYKDEAKYNLAEWLGMPPEIIAADAEAAANELAELVKTSTLSLDFGHFVKRILRAGCTVAAAAHADVLVLCRDNVYCSRQIREDIGKVIAPVVTRGSLPTPSARTWQSRGGHIRRQPFRASRPREPL